MKIGILTYPFNANFGGILQNYALSKFLRSHGHEVQTVCTKKLVNRSFAVQLIAIVVRCVKKYFFQKRGVLVFSEKKLNEENNIISRNTNEFINKNISVRWVNDIRKDIEPNDYDILIVGSDQVWRNNYNVQLYYLDFAKKWNIKRISYAASFGTDDWEYNRATTKKCKALVDLFDDISVREITAVGLCKRYFMVESTWVLDPTFLLSKNAYKQFVNNSNNGQGKVFNYILDKSAEKEESLHSICKLLNKDTFSINADVYNREIPIEKRIQPKVEEWLTSIWNSDFVFTDSFHGMVFSIIFEKPFVVFGNSERGLARFESLLRFIGLEDLLISKSKDVNGSLVNKTIDYNSVHEKLEGLKNASMAFLKKHI